VPLEGDAIIYNLSVNLDMSSIKFYINI
jgi:hypothetical protein